MKKRLLSMLLALVMLFAMIPMAMAEEEPAPEQPEPGVSEEIIIEEPEPADNEEIVSEEPEPADNEEIVPEEPEPADNEEVVPEEPAVDPEPELSPRAPGDLAVDEANFPNADFRSWIIANLPVSGDEISGYYMTEAQVNAVTAIDVSYLNIYSLEGIELFPKLAHLDCGYTKITSLNVSANTELVYLSCPGNQLAALDVSKNAKLQYLGCTNNKLTKLDLHANTQLVEVYCASNQLTNLQINSCTALDTLECNDNQLSALDVGSCTALKYLKCSGNKLTALDVSKNTKLTNLNCNKNQLTALDVSKNTNLVDLSCNENKLTKLDVSKNTALTWLSCAKNQLTALDVSNLTALNYLYCNGNHLTTLDLSKIAHFADCTTKEQMIVNQKGVVKDSKYTFDMTKVVPKTLLAKVKLSNASYKLNTETGVVTFPSEVTFFDYTFDTGYAYTDPWEEDFALMQVSVYLTFEGEAFKPTVEWNKNDVKFNGSTPYVVYNGKTHKPRFVVKDNDGKVIDSKNYTYTYQENKNPGTAYLIITFIKNGYSGVHQAFFKIYLPASKSLKVENTVEGIKLSWAKVQGAAGYVIYRRAWNLSSSSWTAFDRWWNVKGNGTTTWVDGSDSGHKVYAATRYQYGVKAYFEKRYDPVSCTYIGGPENIPSGNYNLGLVSPLKATIRVTPRKLTSVTPGSKQLTVKWEGSKYFTGYQVQIATNSSFTHNDKKIKIENSKTTEVTIINLKSSTTYYVRVRSYHVFEGKTYYGGWSNVMSTKTKKEMTMPDNLPQTQLVVSFTD